MHQQVFLIYGAASGFDDNKSSFSSSDSNKLPPSFAMLPKLISGKLEIALPLDFINISLPSIKYALIFLATVLCMIFDAFCLKIYFSEFELFRKDTIETVTPAFPFALFVHLKEGYAKLISILFF